MISLNLRHFKLARMLHAQSQERRGELYEKIQVLETYISHEDCSAPISPKLGSCFLCNLNELELPL